MRRSTCNRLPGRPSFLPAQPTIPAFIDSALVKPRAGLAGHSAVSQLAEDFRATGPAGLTRDDLLRLGWTAEQIDNLAHAAIVKAQALAGPAL